MKTAFGLLTIVFGSLLAIAMFFTAGWDRPPLDVTQTGYRGVAMEHIVNPRTEAAKMAANKALEPPYEVSAGGQPVSEIYQNVKVLGHLNNDQFNRLMLSITEWVAPKQGCAYCHDETNLADDSKYTKVVSRRMIEMTQNINANWKTHVADTGVTCYTCHRGQAVPAEVWFKADHEPKGANFIGDKAGQNSPAASVKLASLPNDPFTPFLLGDHAIRVNGTTALPTGNRSSIKQTEWTYGLMVHMSASLGVNCTYCHNSRAFSSWDDVPPQRVKAWHGIRMARDVNNEYITPLTEVFPANRKGVLGDLAKVNCATCHQGVNKPLLGASMLKDYPSLASGAK